MTDRILTREQFFECLDAIRSVPPNIDNTHPLYERGESYRKRAERHDAALRERVERLEERDAAFEQFLKDTSDDMECLPGCDSFAHERECPVTYPDVAFRRLRERIERLRGLLVRASDLLPRLVDRAHVNTGEPIGEAYIALSKEIRAALEKGGRDG